MNNNSVNEGRKDQYIQKSRLEPAVFGWAPWLDVPETCSLIVYLHLFAVLVNNSLSKTYKRHFILFRHILFVIIKNLFAITLHYLAIHGCGLNQKWTKHVIYFAPAH